jgi:predicted RNA-binding Zn-ribbon protein involved in translation (DUF1610 family)
MDTEHDMNAATKNEAPTGLPDLETRPCPQCGAIMRLSTEVGEWEELTSPAITAMREANPGLGRTFGRATYVTWWCPACKLNAEAEPVQ